MKNILLVPAFALLCACTSLAGVQPETVETSLTVVPPGLCGPGPSVRSSDPSDEDAVTDLNVFVFNDNSVMEECIFIADASAGRRGSDYVVPLKLLSGRRYSFYVCANMGYAMQPRSLEEVTKLKYYMTRPDEFHRGVPMAGTLKNVTVSEGSAPVVPLERTMAKITLVIDRHKLSDGVSFNVEKVRCCASARCVRLFGESMASSQDELFPSGFVKEGKYDVYTMYVLENLQGDTESDRCTYIELSSSYDSQDKYTKPGDFLVYRFRIGESKGNYDVRRNTHYTVIVTPEGDGLGDGSVSWRIDSSNLSTHYYGEPYFKYYPEKYSECHLGDVVRIWCEFYPPDAPFDIGMEYLETDREDGVCNYEIDPDGHGVTLTFIGKGMALVFFEVGPPVNDCALFCVICEP